MKAFLLYTGSSVIFLWGLGHLLPTRNIVRGFGSQSEDNVRIITMEWIAEGLSLCFIGVLVFITVLFAGPNSQAVKIVAPACAILLFALATLSIFTGARTAIWAMRICPIIKTITAVLFFSGTYL
ncbi:MAG TPA: hypothetical protein VNI35_00360 [Nitrospira sp.]|nr:hypothetical protein [Nitrospira sp.]